MAFLPVSAIKQQDVSSAVGGALQHASIMRYMFEDDQMEQGVTGATWDTQEHWLLRGIPLWVWILTEVTKGTRRCMLQKQRGDRLCLRPPLTTVSLLHLGFYRG